MHGRNATFKPLRRRSAHSRWRSVGLAATGTAQKIIEQVHRGLPYSAMVRFHQTSGLPLARIAELLRIPPRTLVRRKAAGRLGPDESERLLRIAGIFEKAVHLFEGDTHAALQWLATPSGELASHTPLDFSRTEIGAREVEDLIGRLEQGIFT